MALYEITAPDGSVYEIEGPEGASDKQLVTALMRQQREDERAALQERVRQARAAPVEEEEPETSFVGGVGEFFKGLAPGAIGLAETAALGASAILDDESEAAAREKIKEIAGIAKKPFEAAPGYEESVGRKFGEALGSTIPFFALGPLGVAGRVAAGGLGAAAGAGEARERAFEAGATADQRGLATGLGTFVGVTEILPVFKFIDNLGKPLTDGIMSRARRAAATGGAEGLQEASAQIAQNLIAKGIYDPETGVFTGSGEALGYGAGVGGLIQAITDMALGRRQARVRREEEAAEEARLAPAAPTVEQPQGELFPVELAEARAAVAEQAGPPAPREPGFELQAQERDLQAEQQMELPLEVAPEEPVRDERQPDLIDMLEEQQLAEIERVQKLEPIVGAENEAEIQRIRDRNAAEIERAQLKFESDMAELAGRIESRQEKTTQEERLSLLLPIVEAVEPAKIKRLFGSALTEAGFTPEGTQPVFTEREKNLIARVIQFREATPPEPEPTSPETAELEALIPEKKTQRQPEQLGIPGVGKRTAPEIEEEPEVEAEFATVLTPEVLDKTGLPRQSGFYRQLLNKDMADPGQQQLVADVFARVRANPNLSTSTKDAVESIAMQAFGGLASQQEMFGPRGGVRATPREPKRGEQPRGVEPTGVGVGPEGDMGVSGEGRPRGAERTGEPAAPRDEGLAGTQERTATDKPREKVSPTTVDEDAELTPEEEEAIIKEFEDAMAEEMAGETGKTKKAAKETKPRSADRGTKKSTERVAKEPPTAKPKTPPAKEAKEPTPDKTAEDVKEKGNKVWQELAGQPLVDFVDVMSPYYENLAGKEDVATTEDVAAITTLLETPTPKLNEIAKAANIYFSKMGRAVDNLLNISFDIVYDTPLFRRTNETDGEAAFFQGMSGGNARKAREWVSKNLSNDAKLKLEQFLISEQARKEAFTETQLQQLMSAATPQMDTTTLEYVVGDKSAGRVESYLIQGMDLEGAVDQVIQDNITLEEAQKAVKSETKRTRKKAEPTKEPTWTEQEIKDAWDAWDKQNKEEFVRKSEKKNLEIEAVIDLGLPLHPATSALLQAGDLRGALRLMANQLDGTMRTAAQKLVEAVKNTKIVVVDNLKDDAGNSVPGLYDPKTDTIKLDSKLGMTPHVLLHEATHAATSHVLDNKSHPLTKQLTQLYNDVKGALDTAYGATSLDEFVAEAFSNPQFQGKLNSLHPNGQKFSVWQRFTNAITNFIRRMVGLGTKPVETAQDTADRLINSILSPAPDSRNAGSLFAMSTAPGVKQVMDVLGDIQKDIYNRSPGIENFAFKLEDFLGKAVPNNLKKLLLQFLPADVLVDVGEQASNLKIAGGSDLIRLFKEQRAKLGIENDKVNATYEYLAKWAKNNPEKMNILNRIWPKATLGVEVVDGKRIGVDPDRPRSYYEKNKDQLALWDEMRKDWASLGAEGQNAYRQVRDSYSRLFDRILDVIGGTVDVYVNDKQVQKEFRNEVLTRLTEMAGRIDPYFPLFREGDYWLEFSIAGTSKVNPGEYVVKAFSTAGARRKFMEELRGNKDVVQDSINELERPEKLNIDRVPPTSFIGQTFRILSTNNVPPDVQKEMMRLVIDLMPESSFVKSLQARKGTLGFEEDLLYTFKNKAPQLVQQTVRLEFGAKIRLVEEKIREVDVKGDPNRGFIKDELLARGQFARNPPKDGVAETANRLAFLYTIGGNVSSAITQISSMATIIYPYLGGKYGYIDAGAAIKNATKVFINSGFNRRISMTAPNGKQVSVDAGAAPALDNYYEMDDNGKFKVRSGLKLPPKLAKEIEELLPLVETLTENGQLHRSLLADTIGLKDAYEDRTPWERMNAIAAFLFHQSDQFNRQITAIAGYKLELARLAKEEPKLSLAERRKKAAEVSLYETQLTNGGTVLETAPRIAQQGIGRVAMMYKSYGIAINYLLLRTARNAVNNLFAGDKKARDIAFKQLVGVFGSTVFLAGVQGLPLFGVYTMMANLFYDDDEDDAETRVRKAIGEGWYKGAIAEYGGIDISERIGLSNLIFQANRFNKDPSFEEQVAYVFGGPALSVAARFGRGVNDIAEGNVARGIEGMLPTSLANLNKGLFRYPAEDGIMTRRGDPIYDDITTGELMAQALGFAPSEYTFRQEENAATKSKDIATNKLKSKLHKRYYLALRMGDYVAYQDVIEDIYEYNRKHPTNPITPDSIDKSMSQHMETSAKMHNGISISSGMRFEIQQHLSEYKRGYFEDFEEDEEEG